MHWNLTMKALYSGPAHQWEIKLIEQLRIFKN